MAINFLIGEPGGDVDWSDVCYSTSAPPRFTLLLNSRASASVRLTISPGETRQLPVVGQIAKLYDDGSIVYQGTIDQMLKTWVGQSTTYFLDLTLVSMEQRFDNHLISPRRYDNMTCGAIMTDLYNTVAPNETIALGTIEDGPTIPSIEYDQTPLTQAFDDLAKYAGKDWYVDIATNALTMHARATVPAPFTLDMSTIRDHGTEDVLFGTIKSTTTRQDFRTRQKIRLALNAFTPDALRLFGDGNTVVFSSIRPIAQVISINALVGADCATAQCSMSSQPSPGDTVTIGALTYTFVTTLDNTQLRQVLIGATANDTEENLQDAVNGAPTTQGSGYSLPTWANPLVNMFSAGSDAWRIAAKLPGSQINGLALSSTGGAFAWSAAILTGGIDGVLEPPLQVGIQGVDQDKDWYYIPDAVTDNLISAAPMPDGGVVLVQYYAAGSDVIAVENSAIVASQGAIEGSSGLYENIIQPTDTDPVYFDPLAALERIQAALATYEKMGRVFEFSTRTAGLTPGQLLTVNLSDPFTELNGNWLIEQVDAQYTVTELHFRYSVRVLADGRLGTWLDFWEQLALVGSGGSTIIQPSSTQRELDALLIFDFDVTAQGLQTGDTTNSDIVADSEVVIQWTATIDTPSTAPVTIDLTLPDGSSILDANKIVIPANFSGLVSGKNFVGALTTTLNGAITDTATTIVVAANFAPGVAPNFIIQIESEEMLVTAVSGDGLTWTVIRGYAGTSAAAHADTTKVVLITTAVLTTTKITGVIVDAGAGGKRAQVKLYGYRGGVFGFPVSSDASQPLMSVL